MDENRDISIPVIGILLATHNPGSYIEAQIESIRNQVGVSLVIYWGDYKSSIKTKDLVRNLLKDFNYTEISIDRPGPAANFFELLRNCKENFIAFSDQDDYWLPNKLINQVNLIRKFPQTPSLAHSNIEILLDDRRVLRKSICNNHDVTTLLKRNCCQGCTIMINRSARDIILNTLPEKIVWHDWWIGIVISITGKIYKSDETEVLYRIHDRNLVGLPSAFQRFRNFLARDAGIVSYQIQEAINRFDDSLGIDLKAIQNFQNMISNDWKRRLLANLNSKRTRSNIIEDLAHRISWTLRKP